MVSNEWRNKMDRFKRTLAIAVIGMAPMVNTGFDCIDEPFNRAIDRIDGENDTLGDQIGDLFDRFDRLGD